MNESKLRTIAQIKEFLSATQEVGFSVSANALGDDGRYDFIQRVLARFRYASLGKADKGVIRAYLMRCTGYARAQIARLIARCGKLASDQALRKLYTAPKTAYQGKYNAQDVALLVQVDIAYGNACGSTTAAVLKRQHECHGDKRFERLKDLSVSHLYNLRAQQSYQSQRQQITKTRAVQVPIGVRKAPQPHGCAGYIRVDSVHQGDEDKRKGVYHITCVDCVTQWDVTCCVQGISEAFLLDALAQCIEQFPFVIHGFHSDNGSEYINGRVAKMLEKLRIEQTKSRARHSNDNALAESKNNSIVRRHMGYEHIPRDLAGPINAFYTEYFNPWVNYHRPCLYPTHEVDSKGKLRVKYKHKDTQTPLDKLTKLCADNKATLRAGVTLTGLHEQAQLLSDLQATEQMQAQKAQLWQHILRVKKARAARCTQASTEAVNDDTSARSAA